MLQNTISSVRRMIIFKLHLNVVKLFVCRLREKNTKLQSILYSPRAFMNSSKFSEDSRVYLPAIEAMTDSSDVGWRWWWCYWWVREWVSEVDGAYPRLIYPSSCCQPPTDQPLHCTVYPTSLLSYALFVCLYLRRSSFYEYESWHVIYSSSLPKICYKEKSDSAVIL